jgi:hypothetical protein
VQKRTVQKRTVWIGLIGVVQVYLALGICLAVWARDTSDLRKRASWSMPTSEEVRRQVDQWLAEADADAEVRQRIAAMWSEPAKGTDDDAMLDRVTAAIVVAEPRAAEVLAALQSGSAEIPQRFSFLADEQTPPFVRYNLRLAYGRWLTQHAHFDEALEVLGGMTPQQVVDPGALLFYQAVAFHRLLKKDECVAALDKLLENESVLPRRYVTVARLMDADIRPLEVDSLDEIARLMLDIRRRLGFGHAGKRVRQQEDDVIAKLDKRIKQIEEQIQKMPGKGQGSGGPQSSNPAQDSQNLGGKGAGDVDQKRIGSKSGWGNLPPKEREQALQQISKDLPAHYREAIEEYFRKLARDGDQ